MAEPQTQPRSSVSGVVRFLAVIGALASPRPGMLVHIVRSGSPPIGGG